MTIAGAAPPTQPAEFFRGPIWASAQDEARWKLKLLSASTTWARIERESVRLGQRSSALLHIRDIQVPELSAWASEHDLQLAVLAEQPLPESGYAAGTPTTGLRGFRVALTRGRSRDWYAAYAAGDDLRMGSLLGYPECCRRFFVETWGRGDSDPTLQQLAAAGPDGPPSCNSLLRWLGVRLVPHLPCSFACVETARFAAQMLQVAERVEASAGLRDAWELLAQPMTYSVLHGMGTVTLPMLRFEFSTGYTATEVAFTRQGGKADAETPAETPWRDNGFFSGVAMEEAHSVIAAAFGNRSGPTLDLGCGDGTLLERLRIRNRLARAVGVECEADRVSRGAARWPSLELLVGRIENIALWPGPWETVLFMPGRLLELSTADARCVRDALERTSQRILLYAYGDCLTAGGLVELCLKAGLRSPRHVVRGRSAVVEAGVLPQQQGA